MNAIPDDDLVRHAHALRGLARSLVAAQDADDLVQDAALQALRRPPAQARSWLAWLAGVMTKRAAKHHRGHARRERRESAVPERELDASSLPLRVAAHRETIVRLHAALLALPEPYQGVLLLRYFEDLTPAAIAAQTREPIATVKSRLQRGLELLRQRLAADGRDRDWRSGLVAAFGLGRRSALAGLAAAGVTTMVGKLVLGAAAVAIAVLFLWPAAAPTLPVSPAVARVDAGVPASGESAAVNERTLATPANPSSPAADAANASGARVTYVGRCVDERGTPLAGARVVVYCCKSKGGAELFNEAQDSAADGTFHVTLLVAPKAAYHRIEASLPEHCLIGGTCSASPDANTDLGDLVLPLACKVHGRVVDRTGAPQQGVSFRLRPQAGQRSGPVPWSFDNNPTSAADGSFECVGMPSGRYSIVVANRRLAEGATKEIELGRAARSLELEVVVEPPPSPCRGIVVGENDTPLAGAEVRIDEASAKTANDGRFAVTADPNVTWPSANVAVQREGYLDRNVQWRRGDEAELRIVLTRQPALTIRVLDVSGAPVTEFEARVMYPNVSGDLSRTPRTHHDGGVWRVSVRPGDWRVFVKPGDGTLAPSAFEPVHVEAGSEAAATVVVAPWQQRRLVVTDGAKPVAGVHVELLDAGDARVQRNTETFPLDDVKVSGPLFAAILQEGVTDGDGALALRGPRGALALRLTGGSVALQIVQPVRLDEAGDLVVVAERAAQWRGKLTPPDVAAALLAARAPTDTPRERVGIELAGANGETLHRYFEPGFTFAADGRFAIDGLPSGTWYVLVGARQRFAAATITLRAGEVLTQDVDVRAIAPADVTLRLRVDGKPAENAWVNLLGQHAVDATGNRFRSGTSGRADEAGLFRFRTFVGDLTFQFSLEGAHAKAGYLDTVVSVRTPGPQEFVLDLQLGELELDVRAPDGTPAGEATLELRPVGGLYPHLTTAAADGSLRLPIVAGSYVLRVLPKRLATQAAREEFARAHGYNAIEGQWLNAGSLDVAAGAPRRQRITLPDAWAR